MLSIAIYSKKNNPKVKERPGTLFRPLYFAYYVPDSAKKSLNVTPSAAQIRSIVGTPN